MTLSWLGRSERLDKRRRMGRPTDTGENLRKQGPIYRLVGQWPNARSRRAPQARDTGRKTGKLEATGERPSQPLLCSFLYIWHTLTIGERRTGPSSNQSRLCESTPMKNPVRTRVPRAAEGLPKRAAGRTCPVPQREPIPATSREPGGEQASPRWMPVRPAQWANHKTGGEFLPVRACFARVCQKRSAKSGPISFPPKGGAETQPPLMGSCADPCCPPTQAVLRGFFFYVRLRYCQ